MSSNQQKKSRPQQAGTHKKVLIQKRFGHLSGKVGIQKRIVVLLQQSVFSVTNPSIYRQTAFLNEWRYVMRMFVNE